MVTSLLLDRARELGEREAGLVVVVTLRADGSPHASVVNAGIVAHPVTGIPVVGFVVQGRARAKLHHLRARPHATVVFRAGWEWVTVEGDTELLGPDDALEGLPRQHMARVFHEIYAAAIGGAADEWAARDDVIDDEGHTAVLVRPARVYTNPPPARVP